MMNRKHLPIIGRVYAIATMLAIPAISFARTQHAVAGYPSSANGVACWDNSGPVMTNICSNTFGWVMPVDVDSSGMKSIKLVGQVLSPGSASCTLDVYTSSGTVRTQVPFPSLTSTMGPTAPVTFTANSGESAAVVCQASGNSKVKLLGLDYTP